LPDFSPELLALAEEALESMDSRAEQSIDEWATALARDLTQKQP